MKHIILFIKNCLQVVYYNENGQRVQKQYSLDGTYKIIYASKYSRM